MIITFDDLSGIQELKDFLNQQFEMKYLDHLNYFLSSDITFSANGFYLTQAKYVSNLLSQVGLTDSNIANTLIEPHAHLIPSCGKLLSDFTLYRQLVGNLVYLTSAYLDTAYVVH